MKRTNNIVRGIILILSLGIAWQIIAPSEGQTDDCSEIGETCGPYKQELNDPITGTTIWRMTNGELQTPSNPEDTDGADSYFTYFIINPFTDKGDKIVYTERWDPGADRIMVMDTNSGVITKVSASGGSNPVITPDGSKVFFIKKFVYADNTTYDENVYMVKITGPDAYTTEEKITDYSPSSGLYDMDRIDVNSDGTKLLWRVSGANRDALPPGCTDNCEYTQWDTRFILYDIQTGQMEVILEPEDINEDYEDHAFWKNFAFSPTNPSMFFFTNQVYNPGAGLDYRYYIQVYNFATGELTTLEDMTDNEGDTARPSHANWRGDGQRVIAEPSGGGVIDYWIYNLDGSVERNLGFPDIHLGPPYNYNGLAVHMDYHPTDNNVVATGGWMVYWGEDIPLRNVFGLDLNENPEIEERLVDVVGYRRSERSRSNEIMFSPDGTKFVYENARKDNTDTADFYIGITDSVIDPGGPEGPTYVFNYLKPPSNFQSAVVENGINLTWSLYNGKETEGYNIYRGTAPGSYGAPINGNELIPKTTTNFLDTQVVEGTTYYYVITTKEYSGLESEYSNELDVTFSDQGGIDTVGVELIPPSDLEIEQGEAFNFSAIVEHYTNEFATYDLWLKMSRPDGSEILIPSNWLNGASNPRRVSFDGVGSRQYNYICTIPSDEILGNHSIIAYVGDYSEGEILNQDAFAFEVIENGQGQSKTFYAQRTTQNINIDGKLDTAYNQDNKEVVDMSNITEGQIDSDADLRGFFTALWDNENLYVIVKVVDDALVDNSSGINNIWRDDSTEVYLDGLHDQLHSYGSDDCQLTVDLANQLGGVNYSNGPIEHAVFLSKGYYSIEYKIPFSNIGINFPQQNQVIGFDVGINDDDDRQIPESDRDGQIMWNGDSENWRDTSLFGELILGTVSSGPQQNRLNGNELRR